MFCGVFFIRITNSPQNILEYRYELIKNGPLACIAFDEKEAETYNRLLYITNEYVEEECHLLYLGFNSSVYMMKEGTLSVDIPSVLWSDWENGSGFIQYYENHKWPDIIVYNKKYDVNNKLSIMVDDYINDSINNWIQKNYRVIYDDEYMKVYKP